MQVSVAGYRDVRGWLDLAAEVEWFFGDMLGSAGFYHALLRNIDRGTAYCVREDHRPPGAPLAGGLLLSPPKPDRPDYRISWLSVAERWRRRGVGRLLVEHVFALAQSPAACSVITFGEEVAPGQPARRFYERLGFSPEELAPNGPEGGSRQVYRRMAAAKGTPTSVEIRRARREELEAVHALEREYTDSGEGADEIRARYERHPSLFIVARVGDQVVGEASGHRRNDRVTLEAIAVANAYQRRGIGRRLLAAFEAQARRYAHVVDVGSAEGGAERFYLACGYRPASILVRVPSADLPADYRATGYPITGERVVGDSHLFYVAATQYDPGRRDAIRARLGAASAIYVFEKDLGQIHQSALSAPARGDDSAGTGDGGRGAPAAQPGPHR